MKGVTFSPWRTALGDGEGHVAFAIITVLPRVLGLTHISPVSPSPCPLLSHVEDYSSPLPKLTTIFIAPPPP